MLVVSLIGEIDASGVPLLEACRKEVLEKTGVHCVVLFFQAVDAISSDAIPVLAQLQREIRSRPADLRLCSLSESLRAKLVKMGVVRGMEIAEDLRTALLSFNRAA